MSHAGPTDGNTHCHGTTGQKQQSGGCNLGAVANVTLREPFHTTCGKPSLKLLNATPAQRSSQSDLHVEVSATVEAYSVQRVKVWLWSDIEAFISDLTALVRKLKGEAKLFAMSPEGFLFRLTNLDAPGHFELNFAVGSRYQAGNGYFQCGLQAGIEVKLSHLEVLLQWFDAVISLEV